MNNIHSVSQHITIDELNLKFLYKGIDIGIYHELVQDLYANSVMISDEELYKQFEQSYNKQLSVMRNAKINSILYETT